MQSQRRVRRSRLNGKSLAKERSAPIVSDADDQISRDLLFRAKTGQDSFDRLFATLCFAALALSLQFSEREDSTCRWALVAAWLLYAGAALLAGWRLMATPQFDKMNWAELTLRRFISQRRRDLLDPTLLQAIQEGRALDPDTGKSLTLADAQAGVAGEEQKLRTASQNIAKLQAKLKLRFNFAMGMFIAALCVNGFYLAVNFLRQELQS